MSTHRIELDGPNHKKFELESRKNGTRMVLRYTPPGLDTEITHEFDYEPYAVTEIRTEQDLEYECGWILEHIAFQCFHELNLNSNITPSKKVEFLNWLQHEANQCRENYADELSIRRTVEFNGHEVEAAYTPPTQPQMHPPSPPDPGHPPVVVNKPDAMSMEVADKIIGLAKEAHTQMSDRGLYLSHLKDQTQEET